MAAAAPLVAPHHAVPWQHGSCHTFCDARWLHDQAYLADQLGGSHPPLFLPPPVSEHSQRAPTHNRVTSFEPPCQFSLKAHTLHVPHMGGPVPQYCAARPPSSDEYLPNPDSCKAPSKAHPRPRLPLARITTPLFLL